MAERQRKVGRFKEASKRHNSRSIRRMLYDIIDKKYGGSVNQAASSFSAALRAVRDHRGYHRGVSAETLYRTSLDDCYLTYNQLDAMAQVHRIPLSVMFLFTRVRSDMQTLERRKSNEAQRIIAAFREALNHLDNLVMDASGRDEDIYDLLDYSCFEEYVKVYSDKFDETLL